MQIDKLMNEDYVCLRCGHHKDHHGVQVRGDGIITGIYCKECPAMILRGWESVQRINDDERTIDIEERFLVEVASSRSCWTLSASGTDPIKWSPSSGWRPCSRDVQRRRLVEEVVNPEQEKCRLARLQQNLCCGCQYELPIHVLEIDHVIPISKGGGDQAKNIQLLCPYCNKLKGNRSMEYLRNRVLSKGIIRPDLSR